MKRLQRLAQLRLVDIEKNAPAWPPLPDGVTITGQCGGRFSLSLPSGPMLGIPCREGWIVLPPFGAHDGEAIQ